MHRSWPRRTEREELPDFVVAGAPRCGTTSLYHYLDRHSEVVFPVGKEPGTLAQITKTPPFSKLWSNSLVEPEHYRTAFSAQAEGKITGEATPIYMYDDLATSRLVDLYDWIKVILLVREPLDQLCSHIEKLFAVSEECQNMGPAVLLEHNVWGWYLRKCARIGSAAERYAYGKDSDQLLVVSNKCLAANTAEVVEEVLKFLGAPKEASMSNADAVKYNRSTVPRNSLARRIIVSYQDGVLDNVFVPDILKAWGRELLFNEGDRESVRKVCRKSCGDLIEQERDRLNRLPSSIAAFGEVRL